MRIGITLYVNRSGSTLFSRMLSDAAEGVFVFPELGFVVDALLARQGGKRIAGDELASLVLADPRSEAIGLPTETLRQIAAGHSTDDLPALLAALASARFGSPPRAIVLKLESLAYLVEAIDIAFPDADFIHVVRDPRAVVNSMRRTPVPEKPGFDMARGSIVFAARHWRDYQRRVAGIAQTRPVLQLRYEDLGDADACAPVIELLGGRMRAPDSAGGGYRIARIDEALHPHVAGPFLSGRLDGWRDRLSPAEVRLVETICWDEMRKLGYRPEGARLPRWSAVAIRGYLGHAVAMARHVVRTAMRYAMRGDGFRAMVRRLRLMRVARQARPSPRG
jgi:hypothetical protein